MIDKFTRGMRCFDIYLWFIFLAPNTFAWTSAAAFGWQMDKLVIAHRKTYRPNWNLTALVVAAPILVKRILNCRWLPVAVLSTVPTTIELNSFRLHNENKWRLNTDINYLWLFSENLEELELCCVHVFWETSIWCEDRKINWNCQRIKESLVFVCGKSGGILLGRKGRWGGGDEI